MKYSIESAAVTDRGLNPQYPVNEDSYLIVDDHQVFAVADGVGGAHAGEVASRSAVKIIEKSIKKFSRRYSSKKAEFLQKLIAAGNQIIYKLANEKKKQMASTIAIMAIEGDYAVIGHVGDSRIYLARDGNLLQLTKDHTKLQDLLDKNPKLDISREDYYDGHVITKALGVEAQVEPDIQKVILKNEDIFVVCTDGIYTHNSDKEIIENIKKNKRNLKSICETLKSNCYDKGAKDNLTAVVLRIKDLDAKKEDTKRIVANPDVRETSLRS